MPAPSPEDLEAPPVSPYARDTVGTISFLMRLRRLGLASSVLRAFEMVSRETFAPRRYVDLARRDVSLPLPCGQTMTAPFTAARMIAALEVAPGHRVLEIGTGSGFVSAVLAGLGREVVSVERWRTLAVEAAGKLQGEGFASVRVMQGDGLERLGLGLFDRILLNGRVDALPIAALDALAPDGRVVGVRGAASAGDIVAWTHEKSGQMREAAIGLADVPRLVAGIAQTL